MSEAKDFSRELRKPFEAHEIEFRVNRHGVKNGKPWVTVIPYIDSRAVQDRLDDVFGLGGWQNEIKMITANGFICGISIFINDRWVTKWDGAEGSNANGMDLIKSGSSNSLKRAAVLLGIGRYLYELDEFFVDCIISEGWNHPYGNVFKDKKNNNALIAWREPTLPTMALPGFEIDEFISDMRKAESVEELEQSYLMAKKAAKLHNNKNMLQKANEVGKEVKEKLDQKAVLNIQAHTDKISAYISKQLLAFDMVPNVTSVTSLKGALLTELASRAKNTMVDIEPFKIEIEEAFNKRIQQLETKEGE